MRDPYIFKSIGYYCYCTVRKDSEWIVPRLLINLSSGIFKIPYIINVKPMLLNSVALLISLYFPPEFGGGSTGAWNRALVLDKIGFRVYVVCGFPSYPTGKVSGPQYKKKVFYIETIGPFKVIRLRLLPLRHDGYLKRLVIFMNFIFLTIFYLPKILKIAGKVCVVYARAPILFSSISGFVYSKITKSFFIFEAPDLWPEELVPVKTKFSPLIMTIGRVVAKLLYALPDIIVTVSDYAACYLSKEYNPNAPIYGIPIGVDPSQFPRLSKNDSRAQLIENNALDDIRNKFVILYSGLISKLQRVETLAYAANKLKDEQDISILIIGEGPEKQRLQELKIQNGLDNLYILPKQPRNMMPNVISAADVCAVLLAPAPILEIALPSKFYEYLACGRPIIGVCRGELANIINSNNIGSAVNFDDINEFVSVIKSFKNSPALMKSMENNCYSTLQKFSIDSVSSVFRDILKKETKSKLIWQA